MAVVVTGAAGFIGQALVRRLRRSGLAVVAIDRSRLPVDLGTDPGIEQIQSDLLAGGRGIGGPGIGGPGIGGPGIGGPGIGGPGISGPGISGERITAALRDADAVVHLAGCSGVRDDCADVALRRARDNVAAARAICAVTPRDTPLLVMSSSSVYGGARGRACRETDTLRPRGGYALSKARVESVCAARAERGHVLVVRPFTVVGEGQRPDMALSLWAEALARAEVVTVFGSLDRTRDLTCVREAARAIQALAESGAAGTVNLGTGRPRALAEMVEALEEAIGATARVRVVGAAPREVRDTWADTDRLRSLLGWTPRTDLPDAVRRAVSPRLTLAQVG